MNSGGKSDFAPDLIELVDESGRKRMYEILDVIDIGDYITDGEISDNVYYALTPAYENRDYLENDCDEIFLKVVEEDGEDILVTIDDEDEEDKVTAAFFERWNPGQFC